MLWQEAGCWPFTTRLCVGGDSPWYLCFANQTAQEDWGQALRRWATSAAAAARNNLRAPRLASLDMAVQMGGGEGGGGGGGGGEGGGGGRETRDWAEVTMCGWLACETAATTTVPPPPPTSQGGSGAGGRAGWHTRWFVVRDGWLGSYNTPGSHQLSLAAQAEALCAIELEYCALRPRPKRTRCVCLHLRLHLRLRLCLRLCCLCVYGWP
jgi:hypothetical protein